MRHPTDGTLRRLADEPEGVATADREHVAGCAQCLSTLDIVRQDAAAAEAALHHEVTADVDDGWRRLSGAAAAPEPARAARWRVALRSPVIAVAGVIALVAGASVAAANDWLPIFSTKQIAPVTASETDLVNLPDLSSFGELQVTEKPNMREVSDAAEVQKATGLPAPRIGELPRGVTGEPTYRVGDRISAVFTFSAAKTAQAAAAAGHTAPPAPEGLDGSQFQLVAGPGVMAVWSKGRGVPTLMVARAKAPVAYSTGIPFETVRDYLLSLPMMPKNIASQLRSFSGDATTLPLLVSQENMTASTADVGGVPATVLTARNGAVCGVVWVDGGVVTVVGGSLSPDEVLSVARGLR